ncbi:hypothetical protein [Rhodoplanes elegans]|uniref:hypothetical protein n=1 Tax=Rhodoplanes elegans TaxID=29408 RepID=UPI0011B949B4|nr:hypothetical protein [Rhodoplanes elegans]
MSATSADPDWIHAPPARFDLVTCYFPERLQEAEPGLKLRPGLVLAVLRGKTSGRYACRIAYGTKQLKLPRRQHLDLIIQDAADVALLGLARPTRFDLDHTAVLPWTATFFGCWSGFATPVIGTLTEPYVREFAYLMMKRGSVPPPDGV